MPFSGHKTDQYPAPPNQVMRDPIFQELVASLTEETGRPQELVAEEVRDCLGEMCVLPSRSQTSQMLWKKLSNFMSRAYQVDVDDAGLRELAKLGQDASLIFLPNHKSYLDPIFLRSILKKQGFPPNYVLGGDNLAFWPMSSLAKRNGIVFIRREFKGANVYKRTLRAYLGYLLAHNQNLEWYIEGGRSRTGKLRPPRYGILSYVVDAFMAAENETAYIVPVSVAYDQQHEVEAISAEEHGASKSPESIKWMMQYARDQSRTLGRVHIRFGNPLSIGEAVENVRASEAAKAAAQGLATPVDLDRYIVPKIAFEVSYRINQVTPITPTSLITFALLDNDERALDRQEVKNVLTPLLDYISLRALPLTSDVDESELGGLNLALNRLIREGVVSRFDGGTEPVYSINRERVHEAGFYRNSIAHHFINRAMVELALIKVGEEKATDVIAAAWAEVTRLEDLLKYEFFFPTRKEFSQNIEDEVEIAVPDWQSEDWSSENALETLRQAPLHVAHRTIGPFLEAYWVVAMRLAERAPSRHIDRNEFIDECLSVAHQWWLQQYLHSPESISKNLFAGAMQLADNRGLLGTGGEELRARRIAFADELSDAVRRVQQVRKMATKTEGLNKELAI